MSAYASTEWLERHRDDPAIRILEASIAKESYDTAHIPGAQWLDFHGDLLENGDDTSGRIISPVRFASLMSRLGITPQTTVVWYGDRHSSYAVRGFWMMGYYQHPGGCFVLEGGRERWLAEQRPVTADAPPVRATEYPVPAQRTLANQASWPEVLTAIEAPGRVVLDVRSPEEFDGRSVRARHAGHIPGAVNIEWTEATAGDNMLKNEADLRAMYESRGITPDKEIIVHCQLGIRAAHTWFVLKHVLGYPNVKNYDGSWQEWGNRDDLPIER